jgi:hypothetical protein
MLASLAFCSFALAFSVLAQQPLFDVPSALFGDGLWRVNVNFLSANSTKMYNEYKLIAPCITRLQFQELYCLGKSMQVIIYDDSDPVNMKLLSLNSTVPYNCSMNVQDPAQAALMPDYTRGEVTLPAGNFSIKMNLLDGNTTDILGFRGFAVRASIPVETVVLASKCRSGLRPNGPNEDLL